MPKPVGEAGGGMANAIVGSLMVVGHRGDVRDPDRRHQRRLCRGVRRDAVRGGGAVRGRHAQRRAVDRHRRVRLRHRGPAVPAVLCDRRRVRARHHDDPADHADHRGTAAAGASDLKEGALALGATRARAVFTVVLPAALPGIITGILLALARISGETAPLLFTAFNNQYFSTDLRQPISTLTVQVYTYATRPYEDWHRQAWAGALVLVAMVSTCSLLARFATARMERMRRGA